ncbi:hypothetical protein CHS0354_033582 [Potamilus streckersoni]|uniref:Repulsive guidance molecule A n=1 Tax=Potamilus streckersoni TaxID=2493646 RepID=A0AAE0T1B4_9BIVA|nr:hypothetical protein CHS0354_033582 [Potamilus streckersoni]
MKFSCSLSETTSKPLRLSYSSSSCDRAHGGSEDAPEPLSRWRGMGPRPLFSYSAIPSRPLVILLILTLFACTATGCSFDVCWQMYEAAKEHYQFSTPSNEKSTACVPLRTYYNCLKSATNCRGNIKYHSISNVVENQMKGSSCSANGPVYDPSDDQNPPRVHIPDAVCSFNGQKKFRHCGLFGDPHLRTFNNMFQTCKVQGAWPLVNNEYLTVMVTNDPVSHTGGPTATSKLTVLIKQNKECFDEKFLMYQAQTDSLPGTFQDGETAYGKSDSVELIEKVPGEHIEIHIKYIDTIIWVRQIGSYFTFAISIPEEILNSSSSTSEENLDLCVHGCPQRELINYQKFLALKEREINSYVMPRDEALKVCKEEKLTDFYLDSCVFDLMTTGNRNFTVAALAALQDLLKLTPDIAKNEKQRKDIDIYIQLYNSSTSMRTTAMHSFRNILLTLMVCIFTRLQVV